CRGADSSGESLTDAAYHRLMCWITKTRFTKRCCAKETLRFREEHAEYYFSYIWSLTMSWCPQRWRDT
ncbi:hypothetical protein, partial [Pseudoalteromonas sp. S3785]|uniref:hypothetical protein n=1 Tax=Pseudoalteromonas sp. S3785 TaxID=579545 RepID=UPI001BB0F7AF